VRKPIDPPKLIPIVHMEIERDKAFPQLFVILEFSHPTIGRRTATTALGAVELN
jgi:hypothetical protein